MLHEFTNQMQKENEWTRSSLEKICFWNTTDVSLQVLCMSTKYNGVSENIRWVKPFSTGCAVTYSC